MLTVVLPAGRLKVDLARQSLATEHDVDSSLILKLGETSLLLKVECNVLEVSLDLREREPERVLGLVVNLIVGRDLEVVAHLELDDVRKQVLRFESEVLDTIGQRSGVSLGTQLAGVQITYTRSTWLSVYSMRGIGM